MMVGPQVVLLSGRPAMHSSAQKFTAATLVALFAALGPLEHLLHDVAHASAGHSSCHVHGCCSAHAEHDGCSDEQPPAEQHDPDNCAVCRSLALPRLAEAPLPEFVTTNLACDVVIAFLPSTACPIVTLVPIRGPPLNGLEFSV